MSGYFEEFTKNYKPGGEKNKKNNQQGQIYEDELRLEGIQMMQKSSKDNAEDAKNNLAEKNLNSEKEKYLTEIKNPNVLENLEMNPFKQFQNEPFQMQKKYFNSMLRLETDSMNALQSIPESKKKTPDKNPMRTKNTNSNIDFSFKKLVQEKKMTPTVADRKIQPVKPQIQSPAYSIKKSSMYKMSPGGVSLMMQKAQNAKVDAFTSPKINSSTFSRMRGTTTGGPFRLNFLGDDNAGKLTLLKFNIKKKSMKHSVRHMSNIMTGDRQMGIIPGKTRDLVHLGNRRHRINT